MEGNNGCPLNGEQQEPPKGLPTNARSNPGLGSSDPPQVILGSASRGHRGEPLRIKESKPQLESPMETQLSLSHSMAPSQLLSLK